MKRPEGFDRGASGSAGPGRTPARAQEPRPAPRMPRLPKLPARSPRERPAPRERIARTATPTTPASPTPPATPTARARPERADKPRIGHPSAARTARAEFAAAERRRRRDERAEIRRFTRASRRRRIGWLSAGLLVLSLVGLVATAVFSPILALREVLVDGTNRLDPEAIAEAVDGQLGTPLALLDEGRIRRELGEFTLIRSYVTELVPPGTLLIHVVEREPIGVLASTDGFRLVDPAGVTIETTPTQPEGVPVIELAEGEAVDGPAFRSMAEVLLALPSSVLAQVTTISASTRDDVTLELEGSSQRVIWGSADDSDRKATVLARLIALHGGDGPGEYDVSAPGIGIFRED